MRQLLVLAAVAGLAVARPETYREKEDFQFSRSSTDEGSKSGYYGAQRGNMGGNYERAHNMDSLAQNQMSGLVRTVEGELGDGAKQHTGSVYTSANSRGIYGSGNYDLSNLEGRNFQEGVSFGDSHAQSSLTSQQNTGYKRQHSSKTAEYSSSQNLNAGIDSTRAHDGGYASTLDSNAGYGRRQSQAANYGGYNNAGNSEQALSSNTHYRGSNNLQSASQTEDRKTASLNSGYYTQAAGYQGQIYDQRSSLAHTSNGYGSNIHSRLVSGTPVRVVIRPGTGVVVPVAAQTYDNSRNSDTEVLNTNDKPKVKHYESAYSYRKEWEKHDTKPVVGAVPLAIPTLNPYPANSELYEDAQAQTLEQQQRTSGIASQSHHSSHSGYVNSASSSQARQVDYDAQHQISGANTGSNAYHGAVNRDSNGAYIKSATGAYNRGTSGAYIGAANSASASNLNHVADSDIKPKGYQSSYSYHKSWERQGDPYIIKPSTNGLYDGQVSDKLTAASLNQEAYGNSHQYGSHSGHYSHQGYNSHSDDCDENGHIRVARSYNSHQNSKFTRGDIIGQEDLGQQIQKQWEDTVDLGQQTQSKWDNLEDLGQQKQKIEDLTQQTQNKWEEFSQQTENKWDKLQAGQQTQILWGGQQTQTDLGQQTQDTWALVDKDNEPSGNAGRTETEPTDDAMHDDSGVINQTNDKESHTLESEKANKTHHGNTIWDEIKKEEIGQENEDTIETDLTQAENLGQHTQITRDNFQQNENSYNPHQKIIVDLTNSEPNHHNTMFVTPNPHPWMYNQVYHHHNSANQYLAQSSSSSHSHSWQEHSINTNSNHNSNGQTHFLSTTGSSIMSLWDILDNIAKDTIPSHGTDETDYQHVQQEGIVNNLGTQTQNNEFNSVNTDNNHVEGTNSFASHVINSHTTNSSGSSRSTTSKPTTEALYKDDKIRPYDIGRGDIGPEDANKHSQPGWTEGIENLEPHSQPGWTEGMEDQQVQSSGKPTEDLKQHSHLTKPLAQSGEDLSQQVKPVWRPAEDLQHNNKNFNQEGPSGWTEYKEEQKVQSAWKPTEDLQQHSQLTKPLAQPGVDLSEQVKPVWKPAEDLQHNNENLNQEGPSGWTEYMEEQKVQSAWKSTEDLQQHSQLTKPLAQPGVDLSEQVKPVWKPAEDLQHNNENLNQEGPSGWTEDMEDQQVQSSWKPTEDLQQHSHLTEPLAQSGEDLSQQVKPVWRPEEYFQHNNENFNQQSQSGWTADMEDQQVQSSWKPTEDLQQHSHLTEPLAQSGEDLSQQVKPVWRPEEYFQHNNENFNQQSQSGWTADMEDQQVQSFWKPTKQHSHLTKPLAQSGEDLSQQITPLWKPAEDLRQGNENLEQQSQLGWAKNIEDQQVQTGWEPDLQQQSKQTDTFLQPKDQNKHPSNYHQQPEVSEELIVPKKVAAVDSPPEIEVTEKPGFWKSVGNKFTNAKDKVASWFSSR